MRWAFDPGSARPPLGDGSPHVRFVGGDGIPSAMFTAHRADCECSNPLLWVRVVRRYRTAVLPAEQRGDQNGGCPDPRAITVEAGVMRCAITEPEPSWEDWEHEAMVQLDDSHRVDRALCRAMQCIERDNIGHSTLLEAGEPWGPHGGVVAWTQWAHVQLAR